MIENEQLKHQLLQICKGQVLEKLNRIRSKIQDVQHALEAETKSTAGDKHETGRAMLQIEREKLGTQLADNESSQNVLNRINPSQKQKVISLGSVVFTTQFNYFIAISGSEVNIDGIFYYTVSSASPIAKALFGKGERETIIFRDLAITILKVI